MAIQFFASSRCSGERLRRRVRATQDISGGDSDGANCGLVSCGFVRKTSDSGIIKEG